MSPTCIECPLLACRIAPWFGVDYLRYSNISGSTDMRPRYDSRLRKDRVTLKAAISHLQKCAVIAVIGASRNAVKSSFYLKASSNLTLSHVALAQRKIQSPGTIPAVSAWIFPHPRTALNSKRYV